LKNIKLKFCDVAEFSSKDKSAISLRDGVLEYYGSELGLEPADKIFKVYRSPATIANVADMMIGIPLTIEHVDLDQMPPKTGAKVVDARIIDLIDGETDARLGIKNTLKLNDEILFSIAEKTELSLGYAATLVPHNIYDYEQRDIIPHHLAAVQAGRCGHLCSFIDRRKEKPKQEEVKMKLHKAFCDAEGGMSLEQIVELATAFPEAIRSVPIEKIQELLPALQEIVAAAKEVSPEMEEGPAPEIEDEDSGEEMKDEENPEEKKEDIEDEEKEEDKNSFSDADFKKKVESEVKKITDSKLKMYSSVIDKAKTFLPDTYSFKDKSAEQVMRDCLATETTEKFKDSELPLAFKLLKKSSNYANFGDNSISKFDELKNKEL
jgi:hypothetical protein